jgi:putative ATP-dependent endonuclease of OLD family
MLTWRPSAGLNCLIGPGDSTKTSILEAISLLLAHRWNLDFSDADFYDGDIEQEIRIEATITGLSQEMSQLNVFGGRLRGITADGTIVDDPLDGAFPAVTVRLTVDASLEPQWFVVKDSDKEQTRLGRAQRESFAVQRLDENAHAHLRWSQASALARLTGATPDLPLILANAQRAARAAIFKNPDPELLAAAESANVASNSLGGRTITDAKPGLDPRLHLRSGSLVLHDGRLPVDAHGLGTRRLLSLAIQRAALGEAGVLVLDEIEIGLEPHRLRMLLSKLRVAADEGKQVFLTTHSPITLENLEAQSLRVVRSNAGTTTVTDVPAGIEDEEGHYQAIARSAPSALLASRIVVGEGSTEVGLSWALIESWDQAEKSSAASRGVVAANGLDGTRAPLRALQYRYLGYDVALVIDNDGVSPVDTVQQFTDAGGTLVQWKLGNRIEDQLMADLPISALQQTVELAIESNETDDPEASVRAMVQNQLGDDPLPEGLEIVDWIAALTESRIRAALGAASGEKAWFKSESKGYELGKVLAQHLSSVVGTPLAKSVEQMRNFTHPSLP